MKCPLRRSHVLLVSVAADVLCDLLEDLAHVLLQSWSLEEFEVSVVGPRGHVRVALGTPAERR